MYGLGGYGTAPYGTPGGDSGPPVEYLTETMSVLGSLDVQAISTLLDAIEAGDSALGELYATAVLETLSIVDLNTPEARYFFTALEAIRVSGIQAPILTATVSETPSMTENLFADVYRLIALVDAFSIVDGLSVGQTALIAQALAVSAAQVIVAEQGVTDSAAISALLQTQISAYEQLLDAVIAQDGLTGFAVMTVILDDQAAIGDQVEVTGSYLATIADGNSFSVSLVIDGIPFIGVAMNAKTRGITEYANYSFNSLTNFNGTLYGANDAGMFRLEGDDDAGAPIDAFARTALLRIAGGKQARIDCAYLAYRSSGALQMKVVVSGAQGQKVSYVYDMVQVNAESTRPNRIKFGRGMKAAYYAFQINNTNGADFAIDVVEIHPLPLDRRIP